LCSTVSPGAQFRYGLASDLRRGETLWTQDTDTVFAVDRTDIRTRLRDVTDAPPPAARAADAAAPAPTQVLPPSAFRSGQADEALQDSLAYGLYARATEEGREPMRMAGEPATLERIARYRAQATAELHAFAFRYLHNHAEQIRQDAIREYLGRIRRPPGPIALVTASTIGVLLAAALTNAFDPWLEAQGGLGVVLDAVVAWLRSAGS
jgi:hypothetical protein